MPAHCQAAEDRLVVGPQTELELQGVLGHFGLRGWVYELVVIRLALEQDLMQIQEIERAAGEPFRHIGMHLVADDEPPAVEELHSFVEAELAYVACNDASEAVAFVLLHVVDGWLNIEQVSVDPRYARRGIGRALIDHAARIAAEKGLAGLTLTTYVEVPWNGPYYERLGFRFLPAEELSPGMAAIREAEKRRGLDARPRSAMARAREG